MTIRDEDTIDVDEDVDSILAALKKKYSGKSTTRRTSNKIVPLDSYVVHISFGNCRPVIIVFDSLGLRHIPTFKTLREYLVDEAKSKHGMDLAKEDISALHAKVRTF